MYQLKNSIKNTIHYSFLLSTTNAITHIGYGIDNNYVLKVDIPGAKKEDISLKLNDGYLEIGYVVKNENEEKNKHGKFLRKERYYGSMSRSFYVGDAYKQKDINATYSDGVLTITLPIIDATKQSEEPTKIEIK